MARFHVEMTEVDAVVVLLGQLDAWCAELMASVDAAAAGVSDEWSGEAASRFAELLAEWVAGASAMGSGLVAMRGAGADAGTNFQVAADANAGIWS